MYLRDSCEGKKYASGISFWDDETLLELSGSDGCMTLWVY